VEEFWAYSIICQGGQLVWALCNNDVSTGEITYHHMRHKDDYEWQSEGDMV